MAQRPMILLRAAKNRENAMDLLLQRLRSRCEFFGKSIKSMTDWRYMDAAGLDMAIAEGIDGDIGAGFPILAKKHSDRIGKSPRLSRARLDAAISIVDLLEKTYRPGEFPKTSQDWRRIHPASFALAKAFNITLDVTAYFGIKLERTESELPKKREQRSPRKREHNMRYPENQDELKSFLIEFVRTLSMPDGRPIATRAEWRNCHAGSERTAFNAGLGFEICTALGLAFNLYRK